MSGGTGGGGLGDLIGEAESGEAGYGAFNRGVAGDQADQTIDFSQLSISEILALQSLPAGDPTRLFAVGKYLLIPVTIKSAVAALTIDVNVKYSPSIQEKFFRDYLIAMKRPAIKNYITGASGDAGLVDAQIALAHEFSSVGLPSTGRSAFAGISENRAAVAPADSARVLNDECNAYRQNLSNGMSPEQAWDALSPGIAP
jgi:hypothetical protein